MVRRFIAATGIAFITSALLFKPTHAKDVPELSRYGVGGLLILIVAWVLYGDSVMLERIIVVLALAGAGVAMNRLRMALSL